MGFTPINLNGFGLQEKKHKNIQYLMFMAYLLESAPLTDFSFHFWSLLVTVTILCLLKNRVYRTNPLG